MIEEPEHPLFSAPDIPAGRKPSRTPHSSKPGFFGSVTPVVSWLDVRVIYVRVSACPVEDDLWPEILQFRCPPRDISSELELNGARVAAQEGICLYLKRDRVDSESAEATYVSTDRLRAGGSVAFEVSYDGESILCGFLTKSEPRARAGRGCREAENEMQEEMPAGDQAVVTQSQSLRLGWTLDASCTVGAGGCVFMRAKHDFKTLMAPPTAEVCIVGRFLRSPLILTQTVTLSARRRNVQKAALGAIPESDEGRKSVSRDSTPPSTDEEVEGREPDEARGSRSVSKPSAFGGFYDLPMGDSGGGYGLGIYGEGGEDGELSWFNAGVRVGVGLGLGICIGVGIGVGIIVRTYQSTSRTFRRHLF